MVVNLPCLWGSCPNFLRPTCPYTECWLSFQTGSRPTERTTVSYSSCFCGSLPAFPLCGADLFQRTLCHTGSCWPWHGCGSIRSLIIIGFLFPEPCPATGSHASPAGLWHLFLTFYTALAVLRSSWTCLFLHPPDIIQQPGWVIFCPTL